MEGLNPPQREAVLTTEGPVLVLAGAGTGKTAALTARLAHLIATRKAWPSQILAVTFTNKAAREMKARISAISGGAIEGMPWLGTFHSVAARMLRGHAELVGLHSNFTILDTDDQLRVLKQLISAANLDEKRWPARQLAGLIDRWKNRGWTPAQVDAGESEAFAAGRGAELYAAYQERLKTLNACDFGDLLLHMLRIFRAHSDVLDAIPRAFPLPAGRRISGHQPGSVRMAQAARRAAGETCAASATTTSRSIRGAAPKSPTSSSSSMIFPAPKSSASSRIIARPAISSPPPTGSSPTMPAGSARPCGPTPARARRSASSASGTVPRKRAASAKRSNCTSVQGGSLDDVAILVRAQFQTREFEERFIAIGLAYQIIGGFRFYERAEIRDAIAYLRLIVQPADDLAFERIVNQPKRGLGDKAIATIHRHARAVQQPLLLAAATLLDSDELTPQARRSLGNFVADIARWRQMAGTLPHPELARIMLDESGYTAMLQADRSAESAGRLENLAELTRAMEEYDSLQAFLEHVSLVMDNDEARQGDRVTIMTIHAAKGLEFDIIYLPGWEEGVFPSQRAMDEGGLAALEEERRLAYVAITRARRRATILHAANRRIYGQWTSSIPSRFLAELPKSEIEEETTMTGGESLWRAQWSERSDPFAHVARPSRGPGWQRASRLSPSPLAGEGRPAQGASGEGGQRWSNQPPLEVRASAVSLGNKGRDDLSLGQRVFHGKFGYGTIAAIEGNKLEIDFEHAGRKKVLDSFVSAG